MQWTVRPEIKEMVKNPKVRLDREEKGINVDTEDKRRSIIELHTPRGKGVQQIPGGQEEQPR